MNGRHSLFVRGIAIWVCISFLFSSFLWPVPSYAQALPKANIQLPPAGELIQTSEAYAPTMVRGLTLHPENPFKFDFIIDTGDESLEGKAFQQQATKLIKYFLASLTVSEDDLWVNLSPNKKDRMIPTALGKTQLGIDLLAQDYILKQLTASLMYPEGETGRKFWDRIYKRTYQLYGTTEIPVDTLNRVWIVPDKAVVYEHVASVFVVERHLKVLLEGDYRATHQHAPLPNDLSSEMIREVLIPELEREVNTGKNFSSLRQIYNSMILAAWYKRNLRESLLGKAYVNQDKVMGISLQARQLQERIYQQYLEAFKKGVYNYIRDDYDSETQKVVTRKYFSGGAVGVRGSDLKATQGALSTQPEPVRDAVMTPHGEDRLVTWEADIARRVPGDNKIFGIHSDRGFIQFEIGSFPDGEIRLRALNPELIEGANVVLNHYVQSSDDVVQALLLMGHLRQYKVKSIKLVLAGWKPLSEEESEEEGNAYLLGVLSLLADELAYRDLSGDFVTIRNFPKVEPFEKKKLPLNATHLVYIDHPFKKSATEAVDILQGKAVAEHLIVQSRNGRRLVELPDHLEGQDVVLYHSTESSQQIEELLLVLIALRREGVASISLVNTYLGYARQDKISRPGESRSAETMLRLINHLVDHHFVMNVHYGKESGSVSLDKGDERLSVYNLNGFIPMAERMVDDIIAHIAPTIDRKGLTPAQAKTLEQKIENEFSQHPIVIVGPDKGSKIYSEEARRELERLIQKTYGVHIPVYVGYLAKARDPQTGEIKRDSAQLLDIETDEPLTHLGKAPLNAAWAFVLDDMTDTGGTLLSATYLLCEKLGLEWRRILNGVVHGTLSRRLVPFKTGLTAQEIEEATAETKPQEQFIDHEKGRMPPVALYASETVLLPKETSSFHHVSTGQLMSHVIKKLIGKKSRDSSLRMPKVAVKKNVRLAMAQVNPKVGDLVGNFKLIVENIKKARANDADIIVFPELMITGYPPEDLLRKRHFVLQNKEMVKQLLKYTEGITAIVGFVDIDRKGHIYNATAIISNGELKGSYRKNALPNYGVFDEKRYFRRGIGGQLLDFEGNVLSGKVFELDGIKIAINTCEDIWIQPETRELVDGIPEPMDHDLPPVYLEQADFGANLILNNSASPFRKGVVDTREQLLKRRVQETGATIAYTNLIGGQDEVVFDGSSFIMNSDGEITTRAGHFEEDFVITDLEVNTYADSEETPNVIRLKKSTPEERKKKIDSPKKSQKVSEEEAMERALILGLRDYARKNGFTKFVYGNSGGIDSALTGYLLVQAFGAENVTAISMPTQFNSSETRSDAEKAANLLGVTHMEIPIQELYETYLKTLSLGGEIKNKVTKENLQARIRGALLMAFSNDNPGTLVISTGNKSETSVGYATLYGDMAGGYSPLKDVFKTNVFRLARHANEKAGREVIPVSIIDRAPSAELSEGQRDSDSLPDYVSTLDPILVGLVEENLSIEELSRRFDRETVRKVRAMVDQTEHKRRQGPPGTKISRMALGRERRMPITQGYDEETTMRFIEEEGRLVELEQDRDQFQGSADLEESPKTTHRTQPEGYLDRNMDDPPTYTSPDVLKNARSRKNLEGWADPDLDDPLLSDGDRHRLKEEIRAFVQTYVPNTQFKNGRPLNRQETGLNGRGDLGWYGPNLAEDAIILRINQEGEVEVLVAQRDDDSEGWALAGQFAKRDEAGRNFVGVTASKAAYREFNTKINFQREGLVVYEGPAGDWRDTNDAWVHTRGVAVLLTHEESRRLDIEAKRGMKAGSVRWVNARDNTQKFYARHRTLIDRALDKIGANQLQTSVEKKARHFDELTMTIQELDVAFDEFRAGHQNYAEVYDLVIPEAPHGSAYYVAAGLEETLADIRRRRFSPDHIEAIRKLGRYSEEFLKYLSEFIFEGDIQGLREGTVVTPEVPLLRIKTSPVNIRLLEGLIRNRMAFSTNIATKTSRIVQAARGVFVDPKVRAKIIQDDGYDPVQERVVIDYSQRRAQERGSTAASRAAVIGGAFATSNVKAAKQHYLELNGTMAHAFVMMFPPEEEIEAYRIYAETYPDASVFLIDTYDAIEGAKKAIQIAKEMEQKGHKLLGVRIDSGDLVALSKEIRKMLNNAGLSYVKIIASNDLHEEAITDLLSQGAQIDGFGVGTHLGTGGKQAALEMKLVRSDEKRYWRVHQGRGQIQKFVTTRKGRTPMAAYSEDIEEMLHPYWRGGKRVLDSEKPWQAHIRAEIDLKHLKPEQKRLEGALSIPVETRDNPLSLNPETDNYLAVDIQGAFLWGGGLAVKDADDILDNNRKVMNLFPKQNRFASIDRHPWGHVSLASSYKGLPPLATVLTSDFIKDWTEENNPIAEHALFNLADLHVYLEGGYKKEQYLEFVDDVEDLFQELRNRGYVNPYGVKTEAFNGLEFKDFVLSEKYMKDKERIFETLKKHRGVGFQVLWTDHALEGSKEDELHRSMYEKEFAYVVFKGMDGKDDSYSPFESNAGVPTELDDQIRPDKKKKKRLFVTGLAFDYCVGFGAVSAADLGYEEVYVVINSTKPVGFPPESIANMKAQFEKKGIKIITTEELIAANQNLGVKIATSHETPIAHPTIFEEDEGTALEEDFYHLTMGQAMFNRGLHNRKATFDYFYRKPPFSEPYVVVAGIKVFLKDLMSFKFSKDDIEYLRNTGRFSTEYLEFLENFRFSGNIDGLKEGDVAFPHEPIATVTGTMFEMVIETLMLKDMNFATLDASWANHLALQYRGWQIVEDGLSTAQGRAHKSASWAAFIGGANRTTNIDAHLNQGIPLATRNDEGMFIGGNILTGGEKAAHGGVFKLSSIDGEDRLKVSGGDPSKASLPGIKRSYEIRDTKGAVTDVVIGYEERDDLGLQAGRVPQVRQVPWVRNGQVIYSVGDPFDVRAYARSQVRRLGGLERANLSPKLAAAQRALIERASQLKEKAKDAEIPQDKNVAQVTLLIDTDHLLSLDGENSLIDNILRRIMRFAVAKAKHPDLNARFTIVLKRGYKRYILSSSAPKISEWNLEALGEDPASITQTVEEIFEELRALGYPDPKEVRAFPITLESTRDRLIQRLQAGLRELGLEQYLHNIEFKMAPDAEEIGGIDLGSIGQHLEVRSGGWTTTANQFEDLGLPGMTMEIEGLTPRIIKISPISVPHFLSTNEGLPQDASDQVQEAS